MSAILVIVVDYHIDQAFLSTVDRLNDWKLAVQIHRKNKPFLNRYESNHQNKPQHK